MNATLAVMGTVRFPPERMPEVRSHLKTLVEATRQNDGCITYDVAEDLFDPGLIRFSELWPDQETFARHMTAPHVAPWRAASTACGLLDKKYYLFDITGGRML